MTTSESRSRLWGFLFRPVHATPLAILRIAVGILMTVWALTLTPDAQSLLTWLRVSPEGEIGWWQLAPGVSAGLVVTMVWLLVIASASLAVGFRTRTAAWTVFLLTLVLQRFNPAAFNGGDFILRGVLLLGLALAPAGAFLSFDASRKRSSGRAGPAPTAPLINGWALRFIQLHISLGYLLTVLLKLRGDTWLGGTAIWYAFGLEDLARFDVPIWLAAPPLGAVISWLTLIVELGLGLGVWSRRLRPWVLVSGVGLHLGIAIVYEIGFFSYVMIASYLAFLPPRPSPLDYLPGRRLNRLATGRRARAATM